MKENKLSREEVIDKLDTMLIRACADLDEHEPSQIAEPIKKEIRQACKQIKSLLTPIPEDELGLRVRELVIKHWNDNWHDSRTISGEVGWIMKFARELSGKLTPIPEDKLNEFVENCLSELQELIENGWEWDDNAVENRFKKTLKEYDELRRG